MKEWMWPDRNAPAAAGRTGRRLAGSSDTTEEALAGVQARGEAMLHQGAKRSSGEKGLTSGLFQK